MAQRVARLLRQGRDIHACVCCLMRLLCACCLPACRPEAAFHRGGCDRRQADVQQHRDLDFEDNLHSCASPPVCMMSLPTGLKPRQIKVVAVIGGGLMGSGIVTALVLSGVDAILKEVNQQFLDVSMW